MELKFASFDFFTFNLPTFTINSKISQISNDQFDTLINFKHNKI